MNFDLRIPTVFVLGAGASHPYGFPLGSELSGTMQSHLQDSSCKRILNKLGFEELLINDFFEALSGTIYPTIDLFLEKKKRFRDIGAHLIAYTLIPRENHGKLFPPNDWYNTIYRMLAFEEPSKERNVSFVTLNYDRSLEYFLNKNIAINCPDELEEAARNRLDQIEIVHAHGSLGKFPDIKFGGGPFGQIADLEISVHNAAKNIKIVSDHLDDSPEFQKAQQLISKAEQIVFLGFGFNNRTMDLLFEKSEGRKPIWATCYKLPSEPYNLLGEHIELSVTFADHNDTAHAFLERLSVSR